MDLQVGVKALIQNIEGKYLVLARNFDTYQDIKRTDTWDIPGGRITVGTPLLDNLQREIKEETGLEMTSEPKLICAQDILRGTDKHVVRLTFVVSVRPGQITLDAKEHKEFRWMTKEELLTGEGIDQYLRGAIEKL